MPTLEAGLPSETSRPRMWPHACGVQGNLMIGGGEDCPWCGALEESAPARQRDGSPRREMGERDPAKAIDRAIERLRCLDSYVGRPAWDDVVREELAAYCAAPPPDSAPASGETRVTDHSEIRGGHPCGWPECGCCWDAMCGDAVPLASIQPTPATGVDRAGVLEIGMPVEKFTGEARWEGIVRAVYTTGKGSLRYVVEVMPQGFQMIAVPSQLRALQPTAAAKPQSEGER